MATASLQPGDLQHNSSTMVNVDHRGSLSKLSIVGEDEFMTSTVTTPPQRQVKTAAQVVQKDSRDSDETDLEVELAGKVRAVAWEK